MRARIPITAVEAHPKQANEEIHNSLPLSAFLGSIQPQWAHSYIQEDIVVLASDSQT